jgi:carboxymethylenebutenolidase
MVHVGHDLEIPASGDVPATPAYAAFPDGARRGVVVIHEILGRQPEIDRVVERFAAAGYAALAPDLFARGRFTCVRETMRALSSGDGPPVRQVLLARDHLASRAGITGDRIGIIGFCFGGGFALLAGRGFGAVSTNYGPIPSTEAMRGIGPVIACYGGRDRAFAKKGDLLRARLERLGRTPEVHVFPSVGHSFLTDGHHPVSSLLSRPVLRIGYDPSVAEEGWAKILAFFDANL